MREEEQDWDEAIRRARDGDWMQSLVQEHTWASPSESKIVTLLYIAKYLSKISDQATLHKAMNRLWPRTHELMLKRDGISERGSNPQSQFSEKYWEIWHKGIVPENYGSVLLGVHQGLELWAMPSGVTGDGKRKLFELIDAVESRSVRGVGGTVVWVIQRTCWVDASHSLAVASSLEHSESNHELSQKYRMPRIQFSLYKLISFVRN